MKNNNTIVTIVKMIVGNLKISTIIGAFAALFLGACASPGPRPVYQGRVVTGAYGPCGQQGTQWRVFITAPNPSSNPVDIQAFQQKMATVASAAGNKKAAGESREALDAFVVENLGPEARITSIEAIGNTAVPQQVVAASSCGAAQRPLVSVGARAAYGHDGFAVGLNVPPLCGGVMTGYVNVPRRPPQCAPQPYYGRPAYVPRGEIWYVQNPQRRCP